MILENIIVAAFKFFGHMNKEELTKKLELRGIKVEQRDLDHALYLLKDNKLIRECDFDKTRYIYN